jgi:uncharacterized protein (DUF1778 family)
MPQRKTKGYKRDRNGMRCFTLRIHEDDIATIDKAADKANQSRSDYMRQASLEAAGYEYTGTRPGV